MRRLISGIALLSLLTGNALALSIGAISPQSGLNQPFLAYIPINSASPDELDSLQISLGDREQFKLTGIPRPFLLAHLKFSVIRTDQGQPYIKIYSTRTMLEPFLEFLVEYQWSKGTLLQKYTVLLDPVNTAVKAVEPTTPVIPATTVNIPTDDAPQAQELPVATDVAPTPAAAAIVPAVVKSAAVSKGTSASGEVLFGPTAATDTLWSIAAATRPDDSVSIQQMMLAILHTNPGAFSRPNVGSLIKGKTLRIPGLAEIQQIDRKTATDVVKSQYKN